MTPEYPPRNPFPCNSYPTTHERELEWERQEYERLQADLKAMTQEKKGRTAKEESATMRPYRRNGPCPKCGLTSEVDAEGRVTNEIGTRYVPETNAVFDSKEPVRGGDLIALGTAPEHLERFCGRCHYTWGEACLDSAPSILDWTDSEAAADTRPAALRGMEQGLRDIQERNAKMPSDALSTEVAVLRCQLDEAHQESRAFHDHVGRLGEALGHPDIARLQSTAALMDRWIEEVRQLAASTGLAGCANKEADHS